MDALNPANITSALLIRAEMKQACIAHLKLDGKNNSERVHLYLPLSMTFIVCIYLFVLFEILNPGSHFWFVWVLSDLEDRSVNCF